MVTASKVAGTATLTATDSSVDPFVTGTASLAQQLVLAVVDGGSGTGSTAAAPPPPASASLPTVTITGKPAKRGRDRTPTFRFVSSDPAATFQCKLDDRAYRPCGSPATLSLVALGSHRFAVRPIDTVGQIGAPISFGFVVKPHHR
jgi:hypothetical protein